MPESLLLIGQPIVSMYGIADHALLRAGGRLHARGACLSEAWKV
jgi:hypothetical protein